MRAITTKYIGPTNYRGSRVKAKDTENNTATLSWDDALNADQNHAEAALTLCRKMKWTGTLVEGGMKRGNVYVFLEGDHYQI